MFTSGTSERATNDEDFDRVDEVRAGVDAILVGPTPFVPTTRA
jgi:riboflavin biosynthesis pyrimidine reductase